MCEEERGEREAHVPIRSRWESLCEWVRSGCEGVRRGCEGVGRSCEGVGRRCEGVGRSCERVGMKAGDACLYERQ